MVGDLVLLLDESTPRSLWPLALVIETKTGRDGLVRCVRVKTKASKELVRSISKIVFLEAFWEDFVTTDVIIHNTKTLLLILLYTLIISRVF